MKGYYRMIGQLENSQTRTEDLLAPHRLRRPPRMQGLPTVLCIQDGTVLNFPERRACRGRRYVGKNQRSAATLGLHEHATQAVNGERIPLGVAQVLHEAPDGQVERAKPLVLRWCGLGGNGSDDGGIRVDPGIAAKCGFVMWVSIRRIQVSLSAVFPHQELCARSQSGLR